MSGLNLCDEHAQQGKISNNIEIHGDEEIPAFAIPYVLMLAQPQLDQFMGRYFHRSLFDRDKTGLHKPVDGFRRCKPLELEDVYEDVRVRITLPQGDSPTVLEFAGCNAQKFVLEPQVGGLTELKLQVYLRPGLGSDNLSLQEYQHHEVGIEITQGKLALKKNPQQEKLPLEPPKAAVAEGERPVSGGFTQETPVEEIDAALLERHPEQPTMGEHADAERANDEHERELAADEA